MVNVSANFHTLSIKDAPTTRVRIYFIGDAVDCTDDNDVQTNGTLLVWAAGDTDSNKRIAQDGIKFTEYFNTETNIKIGGSVSSHVEITLINTDGWLNGFTYGRCKIYLDVYDSTNSAWLPCPMGVYIIEKPVKGSDRLVRVQGFDQMQFMDKIADSWWNGLDWTNTITLLSIASQLANAVGTTLSGLSLLQMENSLLSYASAPFDCVEMTYRDVAEMIAEASCTVVRYNRNGELDFKWWSPDNSVASISTYTVGNQCLDIDIADYLSYSAGEELKVKIAENNREITIGNASNKYVILNNPFLYAPNDATVTTNATPIYNRMIGFGAYYPIQSKLIWDWSIEAGDVITFYTGPYTSYDCPIFQQEMVWRGGHVVSTVMNSGDHIRPVSDVEDRNYYRLSSESATGNFTNVSASTFNSFLKIERTTIANGASGSINMPNSSSAFLLVSGIRDASKFIASVRANSAGDVSHVEFGTPGAVFSVSTNTLTIANNSNGEMQILIFRF